ncbi:DNA polymerase III subunit [Vallitalea guaymasensis]|uniref:DNA polymerase III subunit delta' n=1 Tax=Vallitalea guaymasensis TaxID=1185412 RepID=A0A8J8SCF3_9FIRM|nr:DNA polymerase III subunit delta' C-terminal domain-containing protein [Vallitalea guaymasensis]QUH29380.1 AAA family ATPase [Vallitalea guaymasensis]
MYTFDEIVGHNEIINHLQSAIKTNKISHAYIIDGEKGIGKKLIANTFAKTLQCQKKGISPCDECISCRTFDSLNNPDVIYVEQTKKTGIGVDDIREQINQDINIKPYQHPYKIYIVDNADTMTEQAQNALLKTIEEPPSYVMILLLSNNINKFLITILSRCVVLKLKPIMPDKVMNYVIEKLQISDYRSELITSFAQGIIGKAKELASSTEFFDMRESMIKIVDIIINGDDYQLLEVSQKFEDYKDDIQDFLDLLMTWFRDLLIVKKINDEMYIINRDKYRTLLKQAQVLSYNRISIMIENINKAKNLLKQNANFRLVIEMMILQTKEN